MKVFAIASALLFVCSTAAAISSPADPVANLAAREASPEALPRWWGFRWQRRGQGGFKRSAEAAPEPWWGFRWSRRGQGGWKRDVSAAPSLKRDAAGDDDFIYLPNGMTPEDLAKMLVHEDEEAPAAAKPE